MNYLNFSSETASQILLKVVMDSIKTPDLVNTSHLTSALSKFYSKLLNPYNYKPPSEEDKNRVLNVEGIFKKGIKLEKETFTEKQRNTVIAISDEIEVNQVDCISLVEVAIKNVQGLKGNSYTAAVHYFHQDFQNSLVTLCTLFQARLLSTLPIKTKETLDKFTNNFVKDGLVQNLCETIVNKKEKTAFHDQRNICARILSYITAEFAMTIENINSIIKTLQIFDNEDLKDLNNIRVSSKLVMTLYLAIDPNRQLYNPTTSQHSEENPLLTEKGFIKEFSSRLLDKNEWKLKGIQSLIAFQWTLFCSKFREVDIKEYFNIFKNGIDFISNLISSESFINDDIYPFYIQAISDTVEEYLAQKPIEKLIYENMNQQEEVFIQTKKNTTILGQPNLFFESFLILISNIYKKNPHLSIEFIKNEKGKIFLNKCSEFVKSMTSMNKHIHVSSFVSFINLLTNLVGDKRTSDIVYKILKEETSQLINWNRFFDEMVYFRKLVPPNLKDEIEKYLDAVLCLITQICEHSVENTRLFLENTQWNVLVSIFGLIQCPFEQKIKGQVFRTLASFYKVPEACIFLWNQLEAAKIVDYEHKFVGIIYQYEEIETKNEKYDVTIGFLNLINFLIKQGIPNTLGTDYRVPGFGPYLRFIVEVFSFSFQKTYKNIQDKWNILSICLEIFYTILENYDPSPQDFQKKMIKIDGKDFELDKPPGFEIVKDLNNGKIKRVLNEIINNGSLNLANDRLLAHGELFEKSVLFSLQIIDLILVKKETFIELSQKNGYDHSGSLSFSESSMKIVSFLGYNGSSQIKYLSSNILYLMSQMDDKLITLKEDINKLKVILIQKLSGEDEAYVPESSEMNYENETRIKIIDLLLLKNSLSIKLCGYKLYNESQLLSSGDHCLQLVISLIMSDNFLINYPQLSGKCLELIHKLCCDPLICVTTIDYLQTFEFFKKNIIRKDLSTHSTYSLNQKEFILKILSEYILVRSLNEQQKTSLQEIIDILFGQKKSKESLEQQRNQMIDILDTFQIPLIKLDKIKVNLEQFYDSNLKQYKIKSCSRYLLQKFTEKEAREIIIQVEKLNNYNTCIFSLESCYQGWSQVCEVILLKCFDMINKDNRERILFDLSNSLLFKLSVEGISNTLEDSISKTILRIIQSFKQERILNTTTQNLPVDQTLSIFSDLLKSIFKDRISQETKINLYSSLLIFLQFTKVNLNQESKYREGFQSLTSPLMIKKMIYDALNGQDILKAIIYSFLDELIVYDFRDRKWEQTLLKEGIINHLIDSLSIYSNSFKDLLDPNRLSNNNTSHIYIYECLMSLFVRISRILPEMGIISKLSSFEFIDVKITDENEERYNALMLPILQLLSSIFLSHKLNEKYAKQIKTFINLHHKSIRRILKSKNYQHIGFVSSLFYILATHHQNIFYHQIDKHFKYEELFHQILIDISLDDDKTETLNFIIGFFTSISHHPLDLQGLGREIFTPKSIFTLFTLLETFTSKIRNEMDGKNTLSLSQTNIFKSRLEITKSMSSYQKKIKSYKIIIENVLLLLFRHLSFFEDLLSKDQDFNYTYDHHEKIKNQISKMSNVFSGLKKLSYDLESQFINVLVDKINQI